MSGGEASGAGWDEARRVLAVRLDTMGDVLMTTPALRALRESAPGRSVTLLTSSAGAEIARLVREIDEVIVYDAPWMKASAPREPGQELLMVERLRARKFAAAVIFTVYSQSPLPAAFLTYLADIPRRLAHSRENPYQLLTDWVAETEPEGGVRHEVRRQLDLVASVGAAVGDERLSVTVTPEADRGAHAALAALGIDEDGSGRGHDADRGGAGRPDAGPGSASRFDGPPLVLVHPGATASSRRYPAEHFAQAIGRLLEAEDCRVVFTGARDERELVDGIRAMIGRPTASLAGRLDLPTLVALIAHARLLIANNTGPVHVAAAVGTPVVDLYALTNPQHAPWQVPSVTLFHDVPCRYCYKSVCPLGHHNCLRLVDPQRVVDAALELLRGERGDVDLVMPPVSPLPWTTRREPSWEDSDESEPSPGPAPHAARDHDPSSCGCGRAG